MNVVANLMHRVIVENEDQSDVAADVADFVGQFKELRFCFDEGAHPYEPVL